MSTQSLLNPCLLCDANSVAGFKLAKDIYCREEFDILPSEQVEESILDVILQSYDNASNGNRTRGGVKKAADMCDDPCPSFISAPH